MATRIVVRGEGTASGSQPAQWQLGLPANTQRKVLEWARPILKTLRIKEGEYIKNGISVELDGVTVEIVHANHSQAYIVQLWRDGLTFGDNRFGRTQAPDAGKWVRGRLTSPASSRLSEEDPW